MRTLRLFCDVVDMASFTEAGRRNYLTQSAVSQQVKALEGRLGQRLLDRTRRRVTLTEAGRVFYQGARELLERYERLERMVKEPPSEVSGTLHVAASVLVGLYMLPPYLTTFLRQHPAVDLRVSYLRTSEVYEAVLSDRAELGLVTFPAPHPQLIIHLLKRDRLVVILPARHPWAHQKRVSLKRLHGQPFIAVESGSPMRKAIDRLLEKAQAHVTIIHTFDNLELIKRAVQIESGLSIVPYQTVTEELRVGVLKCVEITDTRAEQPIGILTRRYRERSLATQHLIRSLLTAEQAAAVAHHASRRRAHRQ